MSRSAAVRAARLEREPMGEEGIVLGLECGGSDALSGITANPALGVASDLLVELFGEHVNTKGELLRGGPESDLSQDLVGE